MYNSDVRVNQNLPEYGKFVEIKEDSRFPAVSVTRFNSPNVAGMAPVSSVDTYSKYAVLTHLVNASDITLTLSASNVDIGNVGIIDHTSGTDVYAQIVRTATVGGDEVGAVRVITTGTTPVSGTITINNPVSSFSLVNPVTAVTINNPVSSFSLVNPVTAVTINNPVSSFSLVNPVTAVTINNPVTAVQVLNPISAFSLTNQITSISVTNFPTQLTAVSVTNFPTQLTAVSVTNQLTGITVLNPVTAVQVLNPVTSFTTTPDPVQLDAFGRLRVSTPLTLFDSSHRYKDNNLWASLTAVGGTYAFNQNQGLMDLSVSDLSGSSVIRETTKVFTYQPGKSLLVLNTFVFAPSATNLRQRTGYFGASNGIYFQMDDGVVSFVKRSLVTGSPSETTVPMSAWNVDKLDGTGPSGFILDVTKAQISWMDIEWLGVGTVRCGFVIDGKFVHCHSFHHANIIASTYITTASLPLRYEITNKAATNGSRTMKQICSSVISEGGYELNGLQQAVGTVITIPKTLTSAGTYYPVVSIRLKASRLDAIIILTALSMMPVSTGNFSWRVIASGTTGGGGAWQDAGVDSAVEYKLDGTSITGGRILAQGYLTANSTYGNSSITNILKESLFKFQLERNGLTNTPYEITLALAASTGGETTHASMDWEEISR